MNTAAIIHTGGIGDLLQTFPCLNALRQKWPLAAVTLVGHGERARLARVAGLVDDTVDVETCGLHRLFSAQAGPADVPARLREADLILTFLNQESFAAGLSRLTAARVVAACSFPEPGACDRSAAQFVYDRLAAQLSLPPREAVPQLTLPADLPEAQSVARRFPDTAPTVVIHPGSGSPKKNWPLARFIELAERLSATGLDTTWVLGPAEMACDALARTAESRHAMVCAPLVEVAALLARARCYVGNDSGITHLAAALGTPTVALFGPSEHTVWSPRGAHVRTLVAPGRLMAAIQVRAVLALCNELSTTQRTGTRRQP